MSFPDHGEFDHIPNAGKMIPHRSLVQLGGTFLSIYLESGDKADFDAAMTLLERAYQWTFKPVAAIGLAMEIEAAAAPVTAHEPHFSDVAEPGPVVHIATATLINPLPRPDELDE